MVLAKPIYGRAVNISSRNIQNIWSVGLSCAALRHNGRNFAEIVIDGSIGRGPLLVVSYMSGTSARAKRFSETCSAYGRPLAYVPAIKSGARIFSDARISASPGSAGRNARLD
jgi:hypothetical protein